MSATSPAQTFLLEAEDLLNQIEEIVLEVDTSSGPGEAINRLFRAFHTIKGSGAMFGFEAVAHFTHHVETVLDKVRDGIVPVSQRLLELTLAARDQIKALLESTESNTPADAGVSERIITNLNDLLGEKTAESSEANPIAKPVDIAMASATGKNASIWRIRFRPPLSIAAHGMDPVVLLNELRALGKAEVTARTDAIPVLETLQSEQCYFSWEILLTTTQGLNAIKDVFIFVEDESEISIETVDDPAQSLPLSTAPRKANSVEKSPSVSLTKESPSPVASRKGFSKESSVRVPSDRLDRLLNLVGELVMNQSRLSQVATQADQANLTVPVEEQERLIAELRDTVLGIRMMPIGTTFTRFKRLVHDLSAELHKEIDLVTEGAETELDKTVLDQLGDPLIHLIRNSIDHGIEPPDVRVASGKVQRGTIRLSAVHTGSNVVITIEDDGKGLDVAAIRAKAIEKNLIASEANLSPQEIFNLIFLPGFSTAKQVTSVSGRGVGMDVVKKEIDALRGSIHIESELGKGTTISATLPLTLAIIDGLLVEIGNDQFIIPMSAVYENVELARIERGRHNGRNLIAVNGELVPYIWLRETFAITGPEPDLEKIVIVRNQGERVGLAVDRVLGSYQTVIQSLGRFYRDIEAFSGATIMGDGRVALILDLAGLIHFVQKQTQNLTTSGHQQHRNPELEKVYL